jgi:FkbM family methyltransferase
MERVWRFRRWTPQDPAETEQMIISYAQRREDILLWRALAGIEHGFYIDVGANDPTLDSVTRLFYERGWSGINVEPSPAWFDRLTTERPRDVNLRLALSDRQGSAEFHEIVGTGLSTVSEIFAARHVEAGFERRTYDVPTETLAAVCREHVRGDIHFLKIDVEGAEEAVLRGADFKTFRPWIVLVEATEPNSDTPTHGPWDPLLRESGYVFTLFDGLNRFYVADERPELSRFFAFPADDYALAASLRERDDLVSQLKSATMRLGGGGDEPSG